MHSLMGGGGGGWGGGGGEGRRGVFVGVKWENICGTKKEMASGWHCGLICVNSVVLF